MKNKLATLRRECKINAATPHYTAIESKDRPSVKWWKLGKNNKVVSFVQPQLRDDYSGIFRDTDAPIDITHYWIMFITFINTMGFYLIRSQLTCRWW